MATTRCSAGELMRTTLSVFLLLCAAPVAAEESPLASAQQAFVKGEYNKAIALAQPAIASDPLKAWRLIGASNCFLKNRAGSLEAYKHLEADGQKFLKYVCSERNDIKLP